MAPENPLRRLARDIMGHFGCDCVTKDGDEPLRCRCRGEGTDSEGNVPGPLRGCFHCQAKYALGYRLPRGTREPRR